MIIMASLQDTESALREYIMKHFLPQIYEALLAASSLSCPDDPLCVLESQLMAFQGHLNVDCIDWQKFVDDAEQHITSMTKSTVDTIIVEQDELPYNLFEKAYSCYRRKVARSCFRGWKRLTAKRKSDALELDLKMEIAQRHYERKQQKVALIKWMNWLKFHKRSQAAAIEKLRTVLSCVHLKPIIVSWCHIVQESKKTKEYFECVLNQKLELDLFETDSHEHQTGEGLSMLPSKLLLKVFQCLDLKDQMNCAEVCCTWKAVIQSGSLWSRINFSVEKDWITDVIVKQILQQYRPFVIHLNMRGCTSLKWTSFSCISECRNLQELNLSECSNITDMMVQRILEGCPNLLYLNLSCTPVTNRGLRELSRSCLSLQYLSLAYCYQFTDKGLQYLTTGKGCHNLVHLDLSGCTQMTVDGFKYISAGCPSLKHIVINDMPTLSDKCVMALVAKCRYLSAVSLLDTPHLSDDAFKAIAEVAKLRIFSTEGNDRMTDVSWKTLCRSSQGLRRLHAADCPRTTDASLKSMSTLKNLQYLDISHCSRVGDVGMRYLTEGASATKLRELNVSHCSRINDISVKRIAQRFSKLYQLNVSYCESLSDSALEWLSGSSITSLDISGCNIQDQGLCALEGIHLKKMVLAECANITDTGIETFCKQVKGLEHLDVSHCVALSDQAIKILSFYCRGLVTLQMSGCPKMTDVAMQYLTSGLHYLRELDVSGCVLLTDRALRYLERNCPPLRFITMAYCSGISKLAALRLQPRVQHWEHSSDDPPYWFGYNNVGQMVQPIRMAGRTDDTWEEEEEDGERALSDNKSRN